MSSRKSNNKKQLQRHRLKQNPILQRKLEKLSPQKCRKRLKVQKRRKSKKIKKKRKRMVKMKNPVKH